MDLATCEPGHILGIELVERGRGFKDGYSDEPSSKAKGADKKWVQDIRSLKAVLQESLGNKFSRIRKYFFVMEHRTDKGTQSL
jgi:hypothetical protein